MWKCGICNTLNLSDEKFCVFCGEKSTVKRNGIISSLLTFLIGKPETDIYTAVTEDAPIRKVGKKEKKIPLVKILCLFMNISVLVMLAVVIILGIFPAITEIISGNENFSILIPQTQVENAKKNITTISKNKWSIITEKYKMIGADVNENTQNIIANFYKSWQIKPDRLSEYTLSFNKSWDKRMICFSRIWGYITNLPSKYYYYWNEAVKNIKRIVGG